MKDCALCGGTGMLVLDNGWLRSLGRRQERCGICHGTGKSNYRPDAAWIRSQKKRREEWAAGRRGSTELAEYLESLKPRPEHSTQAQAPESK